jgi:AcrR family transcriptional regulator
MAISTDASNSPSPLSAGAGDDTAVTDGRLLRRKRNREAVVDALLDLYRAGTLRPSAEEIAARSGVSPRSLFRYFDDMDDLVRTAMGRIERENLHLVPIDIDPRAGLEVKAGALAEQRFRLFDTVGHAAAVLRLRSPYHPVLAAALARNRAFVRGQIRALFAPELLALGSARGIAALAAADVLCSFESYQLLREVNQLSPVGYKVTLSEGLAALFNPRR